MATVEEIYIAPRGGAEMQPVERVEAVTDRGLVGDRYMQRTGYWTGIDECQVTLIEAEAIEWIMDQTQVHAGNGEHRRNIITRGIRLRDVAGRRFRIGTAVLEYDRPRPPCRYIQSVSERGMTKALGRDRGGICARVVHSGVVRVGDGIELLDAGHQTRDVG